MYRLDIGLFGKGFIQKDQLIRWIQGMKHGVKRKVIDKGVRRTFEHLLGNPTISECGTIKGVGKKRSRSLNRIATALKNAQDSSRYKES